MATRKITELLFKATDDNLFEADLMVWDTPHYMSAVEWYKGDKSLKEYCKWQKKRGKDVKVKKTAP